MLNISVNIFKIDSKCTITISDDFLLEYLLLLWTNASQYSVHLSIVTISIFAITIDCYYLLTGVYLVLTQTFRNVNWEPSWTSKMELFCKNGLRLKSVKFLRKKTSSYIFDWVLNVSLLWHLKCKTCNQNTT